MIGVFIATDSMHLSILCELAASSQAILRNKTLFHYFTIISDYFTLLSFTFISSTVNEFWYLLNDRDMNLGVLIFI